VEFVIQLIIQGPVDLVLDHQTSITSRNETFYQPIPMVYNEAIAVKEKEALTRALDSNNLAWPS
jgi:hypothetical protein